MTSRLPTSWCFLAHLGYDFFSIVLFSLFFKKYLCLFWSVCLNLVPVEGQLVHNTLGIQPQILAKSGHLLLVLTVGRVFLWVSINSPLLYPPHYWFSSAFNLSWSKAPIGIDYSTKFGFLSELKRIKKFWSTMFFFRKASELQKQSRMCKDLVTFWQM